MDIESKGISAFWLKIIAITGMVLQHAALSLSGMFPLPVEIFLQLAGGITFPVMAFFIVEGFRATSDLGKYRRRLWIFGFISILPHLFSLGSGLNIMFTLFFGLIALELRKKYGNAPKFWVLFILLLLASALFDWGVVGLVVILLYDTIQDEKTRRIVGPIVAVGGTLIYSTILVTVLGNFIDFEAKMADTTIAGAFFPVGMFLAIPLLLMYKGERGPRMKWLFYTFYPIHLAVLAVLSIILGTNNLLNMF